MDSKLKAATESARLLKDIHNASGNNSPYSTEELNEIIEPVMRDLVKAFGLDVEAL